MTFSSDTYMTIFLHRFCSLALMHLSRLHRLHALTPMAIARTTNRRYYSNNKKNKKL